jgi:hypothetical protein
VLVELELGARAEAVEAAEQVNTLLEARVEWAAYRLRLELLGLPERLALAAVEAVVLITIVVLLLLVPLVVLDL